MNSRRHPHLIAPRSLPPPPLGRVCHRGLVDSAYPHDAALVGASLTAVLLVGWLMPVATAGDEALAYLGPGAGVALVGSLGAVLVAMASAFLTLMTWPIRWVWRSLRGRHAMARARVRRVVILGLDGLDPQLVDQFLSEGRMPNLAKLRDRGTYARLGTTWPPLSPVAWSSFSTGTNPGKHNIFDFLTRSPSDYGPRISSVLMRGSQRTLPLGPYRIPLSRPRVDGLRKSKPFWNVLGEAGIFSAILRVPITFPPDKFHGVQLSAMCVPDLRGTQGTFTYFSEEQGNQEQAALGDLGGERVAVVREGDTVRAELPGPQNPLREGDPAVSAPLIVKRGANGDATLQIGDARVRLTPGEFTDWIHVPFSLAPGVKARGVCRFFLKRFEAPFEMYCTPTHIDPDKPVMPISHPRVYSVYLAKQQGPFATLGLAEDTWSLSEQVMDEDAFLKMSYDIDEERQAMFFDALSRVRRGLVTCVFDGPDRIQHMFWRFQDEGHPALDDDAAKNDAHRHTIRDMYEKMDKLVGRTVEALDEKTALVVMSDHGFKPFRRGVDLNAWLRDAGFLKLKDGAATSDRVYMADVDWSATKAYSLGLAGIFVNERGRETAGIVAPGEEKRQLVADICEGLSGLRDEARDQVAIVEAVARESVYQGPYVEAAPDIIIGYNVGYRVSWDSAVGKCAARVFSDNTKAWSGDHCIHPQKVPGIIFSNLKFNTDEPNIIDLAPTALELLGVSKPGYMDGKSLLVDDPPANGHPANGHSANVKSAEAPSPSGVAAGSAEGSAALDAST